MINIIIYNKMYTDSSSTSLSSHTDRNIIYVNVDNNLGSKQPFKVTLDRPMEKCFMFRKNQYMITAHIKVECCEKVVNHTNSKLLIYNTIAKAVEDFYHKRRSAPYMYFDIKNIGMTQYNTYIYIDSYICK